MPVNFSSPQFWDAKEQEREMLRVFDICHSCRLCFNLCPSFKSLFDTIDAKEGDFSRLPPEDFRSVVTLCYQCKLCYVKCPYTPPHEFDLDFPRVMIWATAVIARKEGLSFRDRILAHTDFLGRMGSWLAPLANWANRNRVNRQIIQALLGLHKGRNLPAFSTTTFANWFKRHKRGTGKKGRVALFHTCFVNYYDPGVGIATVQVLEKNGIEVASPAQRCCGMPYLELGDIRSAVKNAHFNVQSLSQAVKEGYAIVVPGPTCSYMLKKEYPLLLNNDQAELVAQNCFDASQYLLKLKRQGNLDTNFVMSPGKIAYQFPCHLKAQGLGYMSRDLMNLIPGASVQVLENCCGADGTWSFKKEFFDLSLKIGRRLFAEIEEARPATLVTDCPMASLQMEQVTGVKAVHPMEILRSAYGLPG